jgi:hypothetical protein
MAKLKDFIGSRAREIMDSLTQLRAQREEADRKIGALEKELRDLRTAAKAVGIPNGLPQETLGVTRRTRPERTIQDAVMEVLADHHPQGLIALDLLAQLNTKFGWRIVRTSLSPQLSRLKRAGKIINAGTEWRLTTRPQP